MTGLRDVCHSRLEHIPLPSHDSFRERLPALLAWLTALDGVGPRHRLHLRLPLPDRHVLAVDLLRGTVTNCAVRSAAECHAPRAAVDRDGDLGPVVSALLT